MSNTLWVIISWIGQILLLLIMGIVLFIIVAGVLLGLWKLVIKALPKRKPKYVPQNDRDKFDQEIITLSSRVYGSGTAERQAFLSGAKWAWEYFHYE